MRCQCWHPTKQPSKLQPNNLQNYNQTTSRWTSKCRTLRPPSQAQHADRFSLLVPSITIFNIWNPVREHNSCIKLHFNSIQFNSIYYHTSILLHLHRRALDRHRLRCHQSVSPQHRHRHCPDCRRQYLYYQRRHRRHVCSSGAPRATAASHRVTAAPQLAFASGSWQLVGLSALPGSRRTAVEGSRSS